MKRTGPTNDNLRKLIIDLNTISRKLNVPLWSRIAFELNKPTRKRREVNLKQINSYINDGETALVPGKVLGDGILTKKAKVAAFRFSESAKAKIKDSLSIEQLVKENPKAKRVRIIG